VFADLLKKARDVFNAGVREVVRGQKHLFEGGRPWWDWGGVCHALETSDEILEKKFGSFYFSTTSAAPCIKGLF
jgi:hypothetical protein